MVADLPKVGVRSSAKQPYLGKYVPRMLFCYFGGGMKAHSIGVVAQKTASINEKHA